MTARALLVGTLAPLLKPFVSSKVETQWLPSTTTHSQLNAYVQAFKPSIIILFACDLIIKGELLRSMQVVNIHCSILPWCKGPVPHLWTAVESRPFGVTIHKVTDVIDDGPIICSKQLVIEERGHTLYSIYELLASAGALLLAEQWELVTSFNGHKAVHDTNKGSSHSYKMQRPFQKIIDDGLYDPLPVLISKLKLKGMYKAETQQTIP